MQDLSFAIYFIIISVFAILTIERPIKSINHANKSKKSSKGW